MENTVERELGTKGKSQSYKKYMIAFLLVTYGVCYAIGIAYGLAPEFMINTFGELELTQPLVLFILNSPSIMGIFIYFWYGGVDSLLKFLRTTIPMKKDLKLIPIILITMFIYIAIVRFISIAVGLEVPEMTQSFGEKVSIFLRNFYMEIGMLGSAWGWYGFFFPFVQRYVKNNIKAGQITGLVLGLYLAPGFDLGSSYGIFTYVVYVCSFMVYSAMLSYILNDTNNCLLFFLLSFWVMGSGSKLQFYYFTAEVQMIQVILFLIMWFFIHKYYTKRNKGKSQEEILQVFPDFIEERGPIGQVDSSKIEG